MRHLKTYRIFESKFDELMDHIKVLSDMALPLDDKDFDVSIFEDRFREDSYQSYIVVDVVKKGSRSDNNKFTFQVIKEELMEMVDYMDKEGWKILNIEVSILSPLTPSSSNLVKHFNCYLYGSKLMKPEITLDYNRSKKEVTEEIDQLIVKFIEKR